MIIIVIISIIIASFIYSYVIICSRDYQFMPSPPPSFPILYTALYNMASKMLKIM